MIFLLHVGFYSFNFSAFKIQQVLCNLVKFLIVYVILKSSEYHIEMTINMLKIIYFRSKEILQRYFHGFSNLSFYNIGHGTEWLSHKVLEDY